MRTWPLGSTVWVTGNCNEHGYVIGRAYVVVEIDDDGTFRARDPDTGVVGNWLRWQDVDIRPPLGWQACKQVLPPEIVRFLEAFDGIDAVVHLAGESIASSRWTEESKRRVLESRTRGTRLLCEALAARSKRPRVG
mgnify:CR=1 FL=1